MTDSTLYVFTLVAIGIAGLIIGSFLNVVIARVPEGRSIVSPGSRCPKCEKPLEWFDNIPVFSWVALRGRCRNCDQSISLRYPLVELTNSAAWVALGWLCLTVWAENWQGLLPLLLVFSSFSIVLTLIDIDHHRLPDAVVFWMYPTSLAGLIFAGLVSGQWPVIQSLVTAAVWLIAIGGVWLLTSGRGMGFGDVKLAPVLGLVLGWVGFGQGFVGLFSAWLLGGLVGLALILLRRARRGTALAFGPFLIAGFWIGMCFGGPVAHWYLGGMSLN